MFIVDGIAYAGTGKEERKVDSVKVLDGMILIIRFKSGEERLFDATCLLEYPVFQPLKDDGLFRSHSPLPKGRSLQELGVTSHQDAGDAEETLRGASPAPDASTREAAAVRHGSRQP